MQPKHRVQLWLATQIKAHCVACAAVAGAHPPAWQQYTHTLQLPSSQLHSGGGEWVCLVEGGAHGLGDRRGLPKRLQTDEAGPAGVWSRRRSAKQAQQAKARRQQALPEAAAGADIRHALLGGHNVALQVCVAQHRARLAAAVAPTTAAAAAATAASTAAPTTSSGWKRRDRRGG